jgi:hypothetical protein
MTLPHQYTQYFTEGAKLEGGLTVPPGYFQLWKPAEIAKWNDAYEVEEYAPGFLGFGSSGGGEMFAFDDKNRVFMIPFVGMEPAEARLVAGSWVEFVNLMEK